MGSISDFEGITNTLVIDFETFYTTQYSLSKLTTQEYILSPYFEIVLVAVKMDGGKTEWFSGTHEETKEWLEQFPWETSLCVAHNAIFDGAILEWRLGIKPAQYFCTMMGARPTLVPFVPQGRMSLAALSKHLEFTEKGAYVTNAKGLSRKDFDNAGLLKYAAYCVTDTDICNFLADTLIPQLPYEELLSIDATIKKYTRPQLVLDTEVLQQRYATVKQEKADALLNAGLTDRKLLMSNQQFAEALSSLGVIPPYKVSPTTGKETYAFAKDDHQFKALLNHPNPKVQALVAARLQHKSTIEETRIQRLLDVAWATEDSNQFEEPLGFAVPLLYYGAHTGRYSGLDKLNMQNLGRGSELRRAIAAPPGHKIIAGDLSQIEARITACLAGQKDLVEAFRKGTDVYKLFASVLYDKSIEDITSEERFMGKTCILGLGFGMGDKKFIATVKAQGHAVTSTEGYRTVHTYRSTYPKIKGLWNTANNLLMAMPEGRLIELGPVKVDASSALTPNIVLPNGLKLIYPQLKQTAGEWLYDYRGKPSRLFGGKVIENIVQALARIILVSAEMFLYQRGYRAALSVHDELVYVIPEEHAQKFAAVLEKVLTRTVPWMPDLPVAAEVNIGNNYMEAK